MQRSHLVLFDCRHAAVAQPRVCSWPARLEVPGRGSTPRLQQGLSRGSNSSMLLAPGSALGALASGLAPPQVSPATPLRRGFEVVATFDTPTLEARAAARAAGPRPAAVPDAVQGEARLPPRRGRAQRADGALRRRRRAGDVLELRARTCGESPPGAVPHREGALRTQGRVRGRLPCRRRQASGRPTHPSQGRMNLRSAVPFALRPPAKVDDGDRAEPAAARAPAGQGDERAGPVREDEESGGRVLSDVRRAAGEEQGRNHSHAIGAIVCL